MHEVNYSWLSTPPDDRRRPLQHRRQRYAIDVSYDRVLQLCPAPYARASWVPSLREPVALHHLRARHAFRPVYRRDRRRIDEPENHHSEPKTALVLDARARLEVAVVVEFRVAKAAGPNLFKGERLDFDNLEVAWGRPRYADGRRRGHGRPSRACGCRLGPNVPEGRGPRPT